MNRQQMYPFWRSNSCKKPPKTEEDLVTAACILNAMNFPMPYFYEQKHLLYNYAHFPYRRVFK